MRQQLRKTISLWIWLVALTLSSGGLQAQAPTELFFSEYIEGTSNNKALEIYNGTAGPINLATGQYVVQVYSNGSATASSTISLTGVVAANSVYVLANNSATINAAISTKANQTSGSVNYNGNDAVVLRKGGASGTILDVIGQIGNDPGTEWGTGLTSTADNTLRRKAAVCGGDANGADAFNPAIEWDGYATDTFDGLGTHTANCGGTGPGILVSIAATDATGAETGSDPITFTISRTGSTAASLDVNYTVGGTATNGTDYTPALSGNVTIPAGQSAVTITVAPTDDNLVEANETVILTLVDLLTYDLGTASATGTITDNDVVSAVTRIHDIQGAAHISPLNGTPVTNVPGIVTGLRSNGFYMQDPNPDADDRTSEGIFVFTSTAPAVQVGSALTVNGTVAEFRSGGTAGTNNLTVTQIQSPTISVVSTGNALPTPTVLGNGGRTIPNRIIEDQTGNVETGGLAFDPATDGIDFYESLEGMLVQVNNPLAVSPTATSGGAAGEIWVVADNGANATIKSVRGGVIVSAGDFNPERIQIDDALLNPATGAYLTPTVNVGAQLSTIVGVVNWAAGNYEVLVTSAPTVISNGLTKEVTSLAPTANQLTITTFNVQNLAPSDPASKFNNLANRIVNNLNAPDILLLEEIQDNNGATNDGVVDANVTFGLLLNAITAAGGPAYQYRQINPVDDQDGGQPGGNIRVGFLFNPNRVSFVDRPGGTSTSATTVSNVGGVPQLSFNPGRVDPTNPAFANNDGSGPASNSRKPLVGEFRFNGQTVFVVGNHFSSKIPDEGLFGVNQPAALLSEPQRRDQATVVRNFVQSILAIDANANIVALGDLNDFEFSAPVNILKTAPLNALIETLPANERYTYNFEGNSQTIDHILVSNGLFSKLDQYDVVHINSEFVEQDSDHDPSVARFTFAPPVSPLALTVTATPSQFLTTGTTTLSATFSGGTAPYSYTFTGPGTITPNGNTATVSGLPAGVQTFTVIAGDATRPRSQTISTTVSVTVTAIQLQVLHRDVDNYADNNAVQPVLILQNQGGTALPLTALTLRYYLTVENFMPLSNLFIFYAQVGASNVKLRYVPLDAPRQGALGYVEYSFTAEAGQLAANADSGPIQSYFAKSDYGGLNELDDYSYASVRDQLLANPRITAYYNGVLVWGQEPPLITPRRQLRVLTESKNGPSATAITTNLDLRNEGNLPVDYNQLRIRYYFTADNQQLTFYSDFMYEGALQGQLVRINPPLANADTYLEIRPTFSGQLMPLSHLGVLRYSIYSPQGARFDQTNDYSYQERPEELSPNSRIVVYVGNERVWGVEPGPNARQAASVEPGSALSVEVLGNPIQRDQIRVAVTGAAGQPLQYQLTDMNGRIITERQIERAGLMDEQTLPVNNQPAGLLFLRVNTPSQVKTVKVMQF